MSYSVTKKDVQSPEAMEQFELMTVEKMKDIDGKEVQIPKSVGVFTREQLLGQKASLEEHLAEVQAKLDAIDALAKKE